MSAPAPASVGLAEVTFCLRMRHGHAAATIQIPTGDQAALATRLGTDPRARKVFLKLALPGLEIAHVTVTQIFVGTATAYPIPNPHETTRT